MKQKLVLLMMIGATIFTSSCEKLKDATNQTVTLTASAVEMTVSPQAVSTGEIELKSTTGTADLDALIKGNTSGKFGIKNVQSLKINSLTAEIIEGSDANNNFDNLQSTSAVLTATGKTPFTATYAGPSTGAATKINFTVSDTNVKDLITASNVTYTLKAKVTKATTKSLKIKLVATYKVVVNVI
jgi:hypothetical protein